jgi:hypothetical protein
MLAKREGGINMVENMGQEDRLIRFVAGFIYLSLLFFGAARGTLAFTLGLVAVYATVTGALGHDPIYRLLNKSTKGEGRREEN